MNIKSLLLYVAVLILAACGSNFEWFPDPPDSTVPIVSATISGQKVFGNSSTTRINSLPATVLFTSNEKSTVYYTLDGADPTTAAKSVDIPQESVFVPGPDITKTNTILKFFAIDKSTEKNKSLIQTANIVLDAAAADNDPPEIIAKINNKVLFNNMTTSLPATVVFTANEPAKVYYTTDNSPPTENSSFAEILAAAGSANGPPLTATTTLKYFAVDTSLKQNSSLPQTLVINKLTVNIPFILRAMVTGSSDQITSNETIFFTKPTPTAVIDVTFLSSEPATIYYTTAASQAVCTPTKNSPVTILTSGVGKGPTIPSAGTHICFFGINKDGDQSATIKGSILPAP